MCNFKFGSLFAGIGGFDLGFERAGLKCLWQVEIDKYCLKVLEKHWPAVQRFEDIKILKNPPYVDVICGGFPCQDISIAGKGKGIKGERSGLWSEMLRIICEVQPRYVVVENVSALVNRGLSTVLGELAESGYDAEWQVLSAAAFGAPHLRERIFIVAYPKSVNAQSCSKQNRDWQTQIQFRRLSRSNRKTNWQNSTFEFKPVFVRKDDGIPFRVDRLKCLGNAAVPQITEYIGRLLITHNKTLNLT